MSTTDEIKNKIEAAKRKAAQQAVKDHFPEAPNYVGIGSGSTVVYVIEAIKAKSPPAHTSFVPTGSQSKAEIRKAGLNITNYEDLPPHVMLDVAFDGADEVDEEMNCVKGGGNCCFQEKLVVTRAKKFICVADYRKDVPRLLTTTNWTYIPVEAAPVAAGKVIRDLQRLGSPNPSIRLVDEKPLRTDQGNYMIKAPFAPLLTTHDEVPLSTSFLISSNEVKGNTKTGKTVEGHEGLSWEAGQLAAAIKQIEGVLSVGLFVGFDGPEAMRMGGQGGQKPVAVYFGMEDGTVRVRKAPGKEAVVSS